MNIQKTIEDLGYTRKEAQFYLATLSLGEARISEVAAKLKIPRSSAVFLAEHLHKEGLLNYYDRHSHRYWVAENPEKLLSKLKESEMAFGSILPALKAMRPKTVGEKPTVKIYISAPEIRLILEDIVLAKRNFCAIIAWNDWLKLFGKEFVGDWINTHSSQFLNLRLLTPISDEAHDLKRRDAKECRETRFLSKHTASLNTATFIYDCKIAIISLNDKVPTGFLIEDKDVHNTMSVFFEELWSSRA